MNTNSTRLSITPVGRAVARSVLHPRSANQLIEYATRRVKDLLSLHDETDGEQQLHYALLHAAFSSDEYSVSGNSKNLPYQLEDLVGNLLADQSESYLIERPWRRNPKAANAAMLAMRWTEGRPRNQLATEFRPIGSGMLQGMIQEGADILSSWCDCLFVGTAPQLPDEDRPNILQGNPDLLSCLRSLASIIRAYVGNLRKGLPGDVLWMADLTRNDTNDPLLSRSEILALLYHGLTEPSVFLRRDTSHPVIDALKSVEVSNLNEFVRNLRISVQQYRQRRRQELWDASIKRIPVSLRPLFEELRQARGGIFETKTKAILDASGIAYEYLDDGKTPGAADLHLGLNHAVQAVVELKTAEGEGAVSLNGATDVRNGAAIVELDHLPKVTLANPGFDPNVPWQARKIRDLSLVEACHFAYGISLLICAEIDKDIFLNWLTQPGEVSVDHLRNLK